MRLNIPIFAILTSASITLANPVCHKPPPPPSYIPDLEDCLDLVHSIFSIAKLQDDAPILWSRSPPLGVRSRTLPYSFVDVFATSSCEFIVDSIGEVEDDTFPTKEIALRANEVVETCMVQVEKGGESVGASAVGPKGILALVLMRRIPRGVGENEDVRMFNQTAGIRQLANNSSRPVVVSS